MTRNHIDMAKEYNRRDFIGDFDEAIEQIEKLPHFRNWTCSSCGSREKLHALRVYGTCSRCGYSSKFRCYQSPGMEIQDVIESVLLWIGQGDWEGIEEVMDTYLGLKRGERHDEALEANYAKGQSRGTIEQANTAVERVFEELGIVHLHRGVNEAGSSARLIGHVPDGSRVTVFMFKEGDDYVRLTVIAMHPFNADLGKKVLEGIRTQLGE